MIIDRENEPPEREDGVQLEQEAPEDTSVRGALRAAIKETTEREPEGETDATPEKGDEIGRRLEKARQAKAEKAAIRKSGIPVQTGADAVRDKPADKTLGQKESKEVQGDGKSDKVEDKQPKIDPPPFYKNKGKALWDRLSQEDQQFLVQREKEVSDGFAQYGPKTRAFDELAKVIEPHMPAIQRFGVTVPQTIDRLFGWMNALSSNDDNARANAFKMLAQNFNIPLARLVPNQQQSENTQDQTQSDPNNPPPWFERYAGYVNNELQTVRQTNEHLVQQQQAQTQSAATNWLNNWAKDKPYFDQVRQDMQYLFETNKIPLLEGGALDLDAAYKFAVERHPEVQAMIKQETAAKVKAEADERAQKDAKAAADRLARARRAGSSLRPAAPMLATVPQQKPNGVTRGKPKSVRESLIESIQQANES